jgi:hypothetical protein
MIPCDLPFGGIGPVGSVERCQRRASSTFEGFPARLGYGIVVTFCYLKYYDTAPTLLSLGRNTSVSRTMHVAGRILPKPILGGPHHGYVEYVRI